MIKVFYLAACLTLGLGASLAVARLVATTSTQSRPLPEFSNPDGTPCQHPCLLGVRPEMGFNDAMAVLRVHPFTRHLRLARLHNTSISFIAPGLAVSLDRAGDTPSTPFLTTLDLFSMTDSLDEQTALDPPTLQLGDVLVALGRPDAVYTGDHIVSLRYFENHLLVMFHPVTDAAGHFDVNTPISTIMLTADKEGFQLPGRANHWLGLNSIERYERTTGLLRPGAA